MSSQKYNIIILISLILVTASSLAIHHVETKINVYGFEKELRLLIPLSPQVSPQDINIFLVWQDNSTGNEGDISPGRAPNGGITFGNKTNVSNNTGISTSPQIESFGNNTFVIWQDIALVMRRYFSGRA